MGEGKNADNSAGEDRLREESRRRKSAEEETENVEEEQGIAQGERGNCNWSTLSH